jgi:SWI/SNF-related matrix-associated actin-dependent regulator 1 of chromatin subfamily A
MKREDRIPEGFMKAQSEPKLIKNGKWFIADVEYNDRFIAKDAGFMWDAKNKIWKTDQIDTAYKLIQFADPRLVSEMRRLDAANNSSIAASRATDSNINIPAPKGKEYMPFQKAGIEYAHDKGGVLIGDEMGLGKTIQAIGLINLDESIQTVLVICPASLKLNWKREMNSWLTRLFSIEVAGQDFPDADIVIANYDILHKHQKALRDREWDLMIVDEAHYLKNLQTRRTQQVLGKKGRAKKDGTSANINPIPAKRKLFLTGTPILNRPIELWPIIHTLDPVTWNDMGKFTLRYCKAHKGRYTKWDMSGASNLEELQRLLRGSIMIRRKKSEVLIDLPAKLRQVIELPQNGAKQVIEAEKLAFRQHEAALHELAVAVELSKASESREEYIAAVERLRDGVALSFGELAKARRETAVAKIPQVIDFLEALSEKCVVFAHHKDVIHRIYDHFKKKSVVLTGETTLKARDEAVRRFQEDPKIQFFVGSIQAAGVGLTLTAASHVIFCELDWVPGNVMQAEDRLHRIGQRNSVLVQHLVFDKSIDAKIAKTLIAKQAMIDAALDTEDIEGKIPIIPEDSEDLPASSKTKWEHLDKDAEKITKQTAEAIHSALRFLSNMCDGARLQDGQGFNTFDAEIGHSLASQEKLTMKQAALGRHILKKYSKQLGPEIMVTISD